MIGRKGCKYEILRFVNSEDFQVICPDGSVERASDVEGLEGMLGELRIPQFGIGRALADLRRVEGVPRKRLLEVLLAVKKRGRGPGWFRGIVPSDPERGGATDALVQMGLIDEGYQWERDPFKLTKQGEDLLSDYEQFGVGAVGIKFPSPGWKYTIDCN